MRSSAAALLAGLFERLAKVVSLYATRTDQRSSYVSTHFPQPATVTSLSLYSVATFDNRSRTWSIVRNNIW